MPATHYANNSILNYQFKNYGFNNTPVYIGLSASPIDENGEGVTEPNGMGYQRYSGSSISWNFDSHEGATTNITQFSFPKCTGSWGTIIEIFIADSISAGNVLYHSKLSPSIPTYEGTQITINIETLFISERI